MSLAAIRARLAESESRAGRAPGSVTLIAVSKMQPHSRVETVLGAGHRIFGENRVQEAQGKWPGWQARYEGVKLHLVGPLQTNKARAAMDLFDAIHSVDRPRLATTLARLAQEKGACPDVFVQVNTGAEPQKAGVPRAEADSLVAECRRLDLPLCGLMSIPPADEDAAPHFRALAEIAARNGLAGLSMGMSNDFETA